MKKFLLFAAALFALNVSAQDDTLEDITPSSFDFSQKEVGLLEPDGVYHGANIQNPPSEGNGAIPFSTLFETHGRRALFIVGGGQYHNPENHYAENLLAGMAIVDLGGEVGKVLAISGHNSKINEKMKELFPEWTGKIPLALGEFGWGNLNWTTDPDNTPTSEDPTQYNIRCRIVLNVFANEYVESTPIMGAYCSTATRNIYPAGANTNNETAKLGDFIQRYDDGDPVEGDDGYVWDDKKWLVYEFDTNVPNEEGIPTRIKWEMQNAAMANTTIFVKEVKFFLNSEPVDAENAVARKSYITLGMDPVTSVNSIEADVKAEKRVYTISGMEVSGKNMKPGVYVEKNGTKTRKAVIR